MSIAKSEIGRMRRVVVKSPSFRGRSSGAKSETPDWGVELLFLRTRASSSPFFGFRQIVSIAAPAFEQSVDRGDKDLAARAEFADAMPRDLFEQAFSAGKHRNENSPA